MKNDYYQDETMNNYFSEENPNITFGSEGTVTVVCDVPYTSLVNTTMNTSSFNTINLADTTSEYIITGLDPDMSVFETKSTDVDATLNQRGQRYGEFKTHAQITQDLKEVMRLTDNWERLESFQIEALEMIAHKIGRILNGDPNYDDSWVDIAGYAKLVADRL